MPTYRCFFLDSADRVVATDWIACDTDSEAEARADVLLSGSGYPGIEVWDRYRRVHRARRARLARRPLWDEAG